MTGGEESSDRTDSDDQADCANQDDSDDRLGYRCPSCDEVVQMIMVRGPDESYVVPCGCLIPPRSFA